MTTNVTTKQKEVKSIDFNSTENQQIKREFVEREVYCNVNQMTEYILRKSWEDSDAPFNYDDLDMERFSYDGTFISFDEITRKQKDSAKEELEQLIEQIEDYNGEFEILEDAGFEYLTAGIYKANQIEDIKKEVSEIEDLDGEYIEVYEWWMVSSWLAEKLEEKGEIIIDSECIWGRRTTGQAIFLDYVISEICEDLNLLK